MTDQKTDPLDNPTDPPTLYIPEVITETDRDGPIGERVAWRQATPEEIGTVARYLETTFLRALLQDSCTPIPVKITWAGRNKVDSELHSRQWCEHIWERGEPRVHLDTTTDLYIMGQGKLERGELER